MKYTFRVELIGYGDTKEAAWDNALEDLFSDPDPQLEPKVIVMEEE